MWLKWGGFVRRRSSMSSSYPVLGVLVLALAGHILGLEDEGGRVVGHGLGQTQQQVLPLPATKK